MKKLIQPALNHILGYVKVATWPLIAIGFAGVILLATLGQVVLVTHLGTA
jgi:hypothetical protein